MSLLVLLCFNILKFKDHKIQNYFKSIKHTNPELISFLHSMPKGADLHNHAVATIYPTFLIEPALEQKLNYNLDTGDFTQEPLKKDVIVSTNELINRIEYYLTLLRQDSIQGRFQSTLDRLNAFFSVFQLILPNEISSSLFANSILRYKEQNIQYLESIRSFPLKPKVQEELVQILSHDFDISNLSPSYEKILSIIHKSNFL